MFIGKFKESLPDPESFGDDIRNGILYDDNCLRFDDVQFTLIFCGKLFNKKELGLSSYQDDASATAELYKRFGLSAFEKLDGSFTVIVREPGTTTIVRDHHGTNSPVYYNDNYFASSLKLLQQTPGCSTTPDYRQLAAFMTIGYIATPNSSFTGIHKLAAGTALVCTADKQQLHTLFDTSSILPSNESRDLESASEEYGELHARAIRRRIENHDNIGILLSGGYDSGCNLAALRRNYGGDLRSYSIGFKGDNWSELPLAKFMSDRFSTIHQKYEIDGSEISALPEIVQHLGDPFVEGGLMVNYAAMRMIGEPKPAVILGGDGSDQYFGTSGREVALHYLARKYGVMPSLSLLHNLLSHDLFDKDNVSFRMRFHLNKTLNILNGDLFGFEQFTLNKLLKDKLWMPETDKIIVDNRSFEHLYTQHTYKSDIEKIINQVILFKASRMADMFSNRIAFPYMDLELYHFLMRLPVHFKCNGQSTVKIARGQATAKFLLKYHYKPMLPKQITSKKKQGGFAPMPIFFIDSAQRSRIGDFILSSSIVDEFLDRREVEKFIKTYDREASQTGHWFWYKQNRAIQYFNLLTLAVWWEQYVKQRTFTSL